MKLFECFFDIEDVFFDDLFFVDGMEFFFIFGFDFVWDLLLLVLVFIF